VGTRESVFICFHCRRPILRWDNLRAKPVGFSPNVKREAGNWIVPCRHCGEVNVRGEFNPLSLT
jgi:hypothetical protein